MEMQASVHYIRIILNSEEQRLIRMGAASCNTSMAEYTKSSVLAAAAKEMKSFEPPRLEEALEC